MKPMLVLLAVTALGCGEKRDPPFGGWSPDGSEEDADADDNGDAGEGTDDGPVIACEDDWTVGADGISVQPESCLAWSPLSLDPMSWYEAASEAEGELGGCGSDCPEGDGYCATIGFAERNNWRLPSFDELKDAAKTDPNIPDVDAKLWSRETGQGAAGNAWVVNLSKAGIWLELDKEDDGIWIRCVSDG